MVALMCRPTGRAGIPARRVARREETSDAKRDNGDQEWSPSQCADRPGGRTFLTAVLRAANNIAGMHHFGDCRTLRASTKAVRAGRYSDSSLASWLVE
jgi:hypothetical protein